MSFVAVSVIQHLSALIGHFWCFNIMLSSLQFIKCIASLLYDNLSLCCAVVSKSTKEVITMITGICQSMCLFICLIFQQLLNWFQWNLVNGRDMTKGNTCTTFESDLDNSLFTLPTRTTQNRLVRVGSVNTTADTTRQFHLVSNQFRWVFSHLGPFSNFQVFSNFQYISHWIDANWKLRRDETKLSCLVCSYVDTVDAGKTRQFCLIRVCGVNML